MVDSHLNNDSKKANVNALLNMPDLFNYFLTGHMASEFSMVSTTQLYDYKTMNWELELIKELKKHDSNINVLFHDENSEDEMLDITDIEVVDHNDSVVLMVIIGI